MPVAGADTSEPGDVMVDDDGTTGVRDTLEGKVDVSPGEDVLVDVAPDTSEVEDVTDDGDAQGSDAADDARRDVQDDAPDDGGDVADVADPDGGIVTCDSLRCAERNRVCSGEDGVTRCGECMPAFRPVDGACAPILTRDAPLGERCLESRTCAEGLWCAQSGPFQNWRCAPAPRLGESTMSFLWVPAGTATLGSPDDEPGRISSAREAQVDVTFTRDFLVQRTEVTQTQWVAMYSRNPSTRGIACGDCPVDTVTWWSAMDFANRLSQREGLSPCYTLPATCTGNAADGTFDCPPGNVLPTLTSGTLMACDGYRLPTESEWEYAARAGTRGPTWRGVVAGALDACERSAPAMDEMAWWCNNANDQTQPAGDREANPWGLHDMLGNVWEWTLDAELEDASGAAGGSDPAPVGTGVRRVIRGGAYTSFLSGLRVAIRAYQPPSSASRNRGFRLVRRPSPTP